MTSPIYTPHCPTGCYPTWIPVADALPDSCRCVLCSDSECTYLGVYSRKEIIWTPADEGTDGWQDAQTEQPFDSIITHWMELPPVPET